MTSLASPSNRVVPLEAEPHLPIFRWIGEQVVRFRFLVVAFWVIGTVAAVATLPSLASVTQNNNAAFLPKNSPSAHADLLAAPFQQGSAPTSLIVASRSNGPLTPADQAAITSAERAATRVKGVSTVRDQGQSKDGEARKALVELVPAAAFAGSAQAKSAINGIRASFNRVHVPAGLHLYLTGEVASEYDSTKGSQHAQSLTELLSLLFILVLLLLVYRSALAPFLTLIPAGLVLVAAQPIIAESHTLFGVQVSPITSLLLIVLLLGAGTDYGLFLVFRVREEMRAGLSPHEAVIKSVSRVGETITFSAATVMASLLCLLLATFGFYQGLGPALSIGIGVMLLAGLTLTPALLAIAGRVAFWPSNVRPGEYKFGLWGRIAASIIKHPAPVLAVGLIGFGGLAFGVLAYTPAGFGNASNAPSSQSAQGTTALAAHFPAAQSDPTNLILEYPFSVYQRPGTIHAANNVLTRSPALAGVSGPLDPNGTILTGTELRDLHAKLGPAQLLPVTQPVSSTISPAQYDAYRSLGQFISPDGKTVQFYANLRAGDPGSTAASQAVPRVRTELQRAALASGATDSGVAGQAASSYDINSTSDSDLLHIIPIVLLVIGILLAVVLRSLVAPWYLLASVGLSYLAALGLVTIVYVVIGGQDGLNFFLPFLMFVFLLALGEDYNILVMTRIREEAHYSGLGAAVARAVNATGSTVTSAGLVLAGSFAVLTIAGGAQVQQIGIGIGAGIIMDTFLVRTLLIPSTVVLLSRWNWWPSPMWKEQHDVSDPEAILARVRA